MSFKNDLQESIEAEEAFVSLLIQQGLKAGRNTGTTLIEKRLYDVWDSKYRLFEIKLDRLWKKTGNVYFEDDSILRSKADYIIYKLKDDNSWWFIPKKSLKSFLKNPLIKKVSGGDQNAYDSLASLDTFKEHFKQWG